MRRAVKWLGRTLAVVLALPVLLLLVANTGPGRSAITWLTPRLTNDTLRLAGISGRFPDALRIARLELRDPHGNYTTIDNAILDWSPLQLLHRRIVIERLTASHVDVLRLPAGSSGGSGLAAPVILHEFRIAQLDIGAAVSGAPVALALDGSGEMISPTNVSGTLRIRQLDGTGTYSVSGTIDAARLQARLQVDERPHGLLANVAGMPDLGAVTLDATLEGPLRAVATRIVAVAGNLRATVDGAVDLVRDTMDLTVSAGAPAMRPRPDIGWSTLAVDAHVHGPFNRPDATGHLRIDALTAAGARIGRVTADIAGDHEQLRLKGDISGLRILGSDTDLLAPAPLTIQADADLKAADRPVHVILRHPLFSADATARLGEPRRLDASLRLADLAPLAAAVQMPVQGALALNLHAAIADGATTLAADGTVGITGGQRQAIALIGKDGRFSLSAALRGTDLTLSRLRFVGHAASLEAQGHVANDNVNLSWSFAVNDLSAAVPQLTGELQAKGSLDGTAGNLALAADIDGNVAGQSVSSGALDAHIEARGLPNDPNCRITARGDLLGAPVDLAVSLRRDSSGLAIAIEHAAWKSLQAGGDAHLATATMVPAGDLHLTMTRLADLTPLIGRPIAGSLQASLAAPAGPPPALDAQVAVHGLRLDGMGGDVQASASGTIDALQLKLAAVSPDLHGAAARLDAAAMINATQQTVALASLQANWHDQAVRLLTPARIGYGKGITIDRLRLGLRQAVLEASGRVEPELDLTASLRNLPADLVGADGSVQAEARITGAMARPTGHVRLIATGLRLHSGPGRAMPAAGINASADLTGTMARIDARAVAGQSHINLVGGVPLGAAGKLDLRVGGAIDLGLLDPILAAGGRRTRGQITLDGAITGAVAAPDIAGSARLTGGEVQDYTSGLHLRDVAAQIVGDSTRLRIARFDAKAGQGEISGSGSIDVAAAGLPVDLSITARNAQPLASDLVAAVIDGTVTLRGEVLGQLAASGSIRVQRAELRIPERMPATVAVLPIRQPGGVRARPAPTSDVTLDITLTAPRQVYLRGRGLDAEFGGTMQLGGTVSMPHARGGFDLRRGSISLAGRSLDFTEGRIGFTGGGIADPALHLVATSTSSGISATLAIDGTPRNPKITLSSVPALPQDEVLAHLLFGSGTGRLGVFEVAQIASGLATLTGTGGIGDPLDKVRQGLGLDRLSVRNSANGSPTLEAGRYIAPRVYLGAKQNTSGGTQASVQVDITKGLKLEASTGTNTGSATGAAGESNGSSVGVTYRFDY